MVATIRPPRMPRLGDRHLPFQSREPRIVTIECDPLAAPLDRKSREPGIGNARSSRVRLDAQASENAPVPVAGLHNLNARALVVIRTTALNTLGDTPNWESLNTTAASQARHTPC